MFGHDDQHNNQENQEHHEHQQQDGAVVAPHDGMTQSDDTSAMGGYVADDDQTVTPVAGATDDLLDIKQEALQALSPLVHQLDQSPEEKFRTTMMMIQAADNHSLVREAYEAAKQIGNEKERAQALLDIVNEINYFTQHGQNV